MKKPLHIGIVILALVAVFSVAHQAHADEFGTYSSGATQSAIVSSINCASSTARVSGTLTSISAIASSTLASQIEFAIYSVNGTNGNPNTLLAQTSPVSIPTTKNIVSAAINYTISSGTSYYLCEWANNNYNYYYANITGGFIDIDTTHTFDTWGSSFTFNSIQGFRVLSIWADITPTDGFGFTSTDPNSTFNSVQFYICSSTTPPKDGTITALNTIASSSGSTGLATILGVAIYSNSGSLPNTPLVTNAPSNVAAPISKSWVSFPISLSVTAGTVYWFCLWGNGKFDYYPSTVPSWNSSQQFVTDVHSAWETWPTFNLNSRSTNNVLNIYASFTPTPVSTSVFNSFVVKFGQVFSVKFGSIFNVQ